MELSLTSPELHFDCSLQRKRLGFDFDEEVSSCLLHLLHPDIACPGLRHVGELEHVHGAILLAYVVQGQPDTYSLKWKERPVSAVLVPGDLKTLAWQLAEDPRGEQSQSGIVQQLSGNRESVGMAGQLCK